MSQAIWSPSAQKELAEIAFYIGVEDARPAAAERIIRAAHALANLVATQPEMGAARLEFGRHVRACMCEKRWIMLYRKSTDGIEVLHIFDATRDIGRLLSDD